MTATTVLVLGGGFAGSMAAAALAPYADEVIIAERDEVLPSDPMPRRGLPQGPHAHILWSAGADAVESLLPGTMATWTKAGANRVPVPEAMIALSPAGWYRLWPESHYLVAASRELLDWGMRQSVLANPRIRHLYGSEATSLLGAASRVRGARIRRADGSHIEVGADLVIDTTGRASRAGHWLTELGLPPVTTESIDSGLAYATRRYRAPAPTKGWPVVTVQADSRRPEPGRGATILPIEDDQWIVSLSGTKGGTPTASNGEFEDFARGLRTPLVADLIARAEPITDVALTHSTGNRRIRFDRARLPEGFLVLGDSACAFNPVYGHGMTVAALGAKALRREASKPGGFTARGFTRRAQRAITRPAAYAWLLATGSDIHFPGAKGKIPNTADRLANQYVNRLIHTATGDHYVATALTEVMTLTAGAHALAHPRALLSAARGPGKPKLAGPPLPPQVRDLLAREPQLAARSS